MSKWTKLKKNPNLFFKDMVAKRLGLAHFEAPTNAIVKSNTNQVEKQLNTAIVKKKVTPVAKKKPIVPSAKKVVPNYMDVLPSWFNSTLQSKSKDVDKRVFLYFPWIHSHGDALISKIDQSRFLIEPFSMILNISEHETRRSVSRFVRENPDIYRKLVIKALLPFKNNISGFLFTLDWPPAMRIIVEVCRDLGIPTILIPHESVFADKEMYYKDPTALASMPKTDYILCWGQLQKNIFSERGYGASRIIPVGAPKFDIYFDYQPLVERSQFFKIYGLDENKKTILFAAQPLDSQFDARVARDAQRDAISDLLKLCEVKSLQLIVRMPPSKDNILNKELFDVITESDYAVIDDANYYLVSPEEAIYHSDFVASINSTMLFEAILMGRYAISTKYVEFEQIWEHAGIPAAKNFEELDIIFDKMLANDWTISSEGMAWAADQFGIGKFDGLASQRVEEYLYQFQDQYNNQTFSFAKDVLATFLSKERLDVVGIPSSIATLESTQVHLKELLNANTVISSVKKTVTDLSSVDILCQWGITESNNKKHQRMMGKKLGKPVVIIEDGFIRSVDIGLSGTPTLSIITDDLTSYYDATKPSRLETILVSDSELSEEQDTFSRETINRIVKERVSKYNHAKNWPVAIGRPGVKKILLIDQRFGDQSVASAMADENTFEQMLCDAVVNNPDADIIIKQHPDAIKGGKSSYYSDERVGAFRKINNTENLYTINIDINPYAILDIIDEVYVVSSGMGMEALMAGKTVHCYGAPYYSGWGLTHDQIVIPRRNRQRRLEDVFYYSYIELSRYLNPKTEKLGDIHDVIDYIIENRGW
ncbi:hypothetical protein [Wohlfahrtiimonas chitiniclastica]|uniref:capsular polysaccharide export protein, LipB/KpsS family n=1 Tax=Wohlfahrtiimonas chitiniclastica TaxID=400946 RepID=UPI001BCCFCDC|nr:hypothetical protein [Wohlfahrtiimonas chitiniclastica]MBS7817317.1 hypothetical protein [Wohlfahrtiimonas chitiniclastica]MBS7823109.1 hypothetical protein [Wohlfahrtiimonas chitiniclastica]MBS7830923.1 hypothetical protein [Wohlfahrtiimonas chitiniclastica]MBS7832891.1 hypothetical protein [Wohlfahrtiimonas chitiniclastica]